MDETIALPSEKAAEIALRTQQLIAYETGVTNVVDPLGGSWFLENLTDEMEVKTEEYFSEIDDLGGVIPAIEQGYQQREISKAASIYQDKIDNNKRIVVGVNKFINDEKEIDIPILEIDTRAEQSQLEKLDQLKRNRDQKQVENSLKQIRKTCQTGDNLMPIIINAVKAYCTLGEIVDAMKTEFGEWQESSIF
tara:strand:- start:70 stop:648 length:579 start_codon:yes stop_codon:yes gene_type:complete